MTDAELRRLDAKMVKFLKGVAKLMEGFHPQQAAQINHVRADTIVRLAQDYARR